MLKRLSGLLPAEPLLEENPKWTALNEILKEIQLEIDGRSQEFPSVKTLVVADDDRTCHQLRQMLEVGARDFLLRLHQKTLDSAQQ